MNDNLNDSKMDTFSPKVFQERQSRENINFQPITKIPPLNLKYTVEFINDTQKSLNQNLTPIESTQSLKRDVSKKSIEKNEGVSVAAAAAKQ